MAVDYFTKWVEAEPLGSITQEQVIKFIWKNLICRFGLPRSIVTDNGTQFTGGLTEDFLSKYHIQHKLSSVSHPQTNGQAEVTNRTIIQSIKTRLLQTGKRWVDELPSVLWDMNIGPPSRLIGLMLLPLALSPSSSSPFKEVFASPSFLSRRSLFRNGMFSLAFFFPMLGEY